MSKPDKPWFGVWSPPWATHVKGYWTERETDPDTKLPLPQDIYMCCEHCKGEFNTTCSTGSIKTHITRFGWIHLHKDAFDPSYKKEGT